MIICRQCGERNEPGAQFCGACDAFLEWEGASTTALYPMQQPPTEQQAARQQPAGAPPAAPPAPPPIPPVAPAPPQPAPQPAPPPRPTLAQPTEVRQRQRPGPQAAAELRPPQPGELVCGQCGAGNLPSRKFCARCGAALTEARVVRLPWWRRLFAKRTRVRTSAASERPRGAELRRRAVKTRTAGRRAMRWVRNLLALTAVGGGVMYAAVSPFREMVNEQVIAAKDGIEGMFTTELVPVRPTKVTATAQLTGHGGKLAADNIADSYWAAPVGAEPVLVLTFERPAQLDKAIVRSGIAEDFQSAHRPRKLHLVFSTGKTHDVTLADTPDPQEVAIANSAGAKRVEIHVVDLYRSLSGKHVAVSEIEFFEPR